MLHIYNISMSGETAKKVKVWFCVRSSFKIQDDESLL